MNALIYTRVSHEKQVRGEYTSLDVQREECLRYLVNEFPDAHLLDIIEETVSAANPNRPGLTRIIELVQARAVDLIIVYMWSRLVRDPWDSMYLRRLCQERGIRIRCAKEDLVNVFLQQLESEDAMQRWMAETMLFNLDQALKMERIQVSKRTKENMRRRVLEGRYPGRTTPFGYRLVDGGLVLDPETAPLVADAFRIYIETHSPARVRDYLNLMTQRRWSVQTVRYMLSNPTYKGVLKWGEIELTGVIPPIVDADTWARAQHLRIIKTRRVSRRPDFDWYLRGRIWCVCGYSMTGYSVNGNRWTPYYLCMSTKYGHRSQCPVRYVNAHRVHEAVGVAIAAIAEEEWLQELFADGISADEERAAERERLERELQQVRLQIELLLGAVQVEGEARSVVRRIRELEEREKEIQIKLLSMREPEQFSLQEIQTALREFALAWEAMTEAERHELVSLVVRRVKVRRKDAFDVELDVPSSNMWEEWLPTRSLVRICANVVDLPREGIRVADLRLGGNDYG